MAVRRRDFITIFCGAATWPLAARAQQLAVGMRRIGILLPFAESDAETRVHIEIFRKQLQELGWTDGNVQIELRWGEGKLDHIQKLAKELVALKPDVIIGRTTPVTKSILRETATIPIVFVAVSDPVGDGIVASIARPGGNVTGFTNVEASLGGKWLEVLKEISPAIARVAVIFDPKTSPGGGSYYLRLIEDAALSVGIKAISTPVRDAGEIERAIVAFARESKVA